ncbi:MAG: histidinol-phosphate transaminase [Balneolaceae bacterium]|nr:histidinol-phosphate transaminase [Balneolaceae bacterium]MBO6546824.1 histidinol-phosphate transaminase [Balneolaceae bacterium]MBO6649184.1 histidinol-phosphate transaminase [Balneolaceae bacterium]
MDLKPYRSARDDFDSGILLDANENSLGAPFEDTLELNRYPMPYQEELRAKIADFREVNQENVFVGVGSDEAIDLLFRIFCEPGKDRVLITPPTYGMYKVSAAINNVTVDEVLLSEDFQLCVVETLSAVTENTKLIFLCSPNNPTGNSLNTEDILTVADRFDGILVLDEAYIDFSERASFAKDILNRNNLVILQTMSKAFGLAGIRLGVALADPQVIDFMMKVKAPYNVNKLTSKAALRGFNYINVMREKVDQIKSEREKVIHKLNLIPEIQKVYPTDANFLIFKIKDAITIYKKMAELGVVIRYRGNEPHCENCLRLTIGTPQENMRFFEALEKVLED